MQVTTSIGIQVEKYEQLKALADKLHVSRNKLLSEGVDLVLAKYEH